MKPLSEDLYVFGSRIGTHVLFWIIYFIFYSFLWAEEDQLFRSFQLEFILMPIRIGASYGAIYFLIPRFLERGRMIHFFVGYLLLILIAGFSQRVMTYFFHEVFFLDGEELWHIGMIVKSIVLVNSTVMLITSSKIYKLWYQARKDTSEETEQPIEIRSEKRFYRVLPSTILYLEGLGNYVTFYLEKDKNLIAYMTLKEAKQVLPDDFQRIHKSFIVNGKKVNSYNHENVEVGNRIIPIGKSYSFS